MTTIRELTEEYVAAFDTRDMNLITGLLAEDFKLTDPEVTELTPRADVLEYIKGIFDANETFSFEAHDILVYENTSAIHFTLKLNALVIDGVDIINWESEKMTSINAYLTPRR